MSTLMIFGLFEAGPLPGANQMGSALKERLIVLGAGLVVFLLALAWAILSSRKRRRAARRADRHHRRRSFAKDAAKGISEIKNFVKEHQRRRRRHRPRNPTLAETGGLPPVRDDRQPPRTPSP